MRRREERMHRKDAKTQRIGKEKRNPLTPFEKGGIVEVSFLRKQESFLI
jgi:hypothetical protein